MDSTVLLDAAFGSMAGDPDYNLAADLDGNGGLPQQTDRF